MNEIQYTHNKSLLHDYLLNLITISADILKNLDMYYMENVDTVGKLVSALNEYRLNELEELPF